MENKKHGIFVGDIVMDEKTGETWKDQNMKLEHNIPLKTLVEVDCEEIDSHGVRAFVVSHDRDCDGTPLYSISLDKNWKEDMYGQYTMLAQAKKDHGYNEESLKVIKLPENNE